MAKKKTIDLRSVDPTPVPAGDVNIIYNGVRIGGFSEDTEGTLKTAGCRVEQDIHVNYTKPDDMIKTGNISLTVPNEGFIAQQGSGFACAALYNTGSGYIDVSFGENNWQNVSKYIPGYDVIEQSLIAGMFIKAESDAYDVTVNGTPISYERGAYLAIAHVPNYENVNIVIAIKEK